MPGPVFVNFSLGGILVGCLRNILSDMLISVQVSLRVPFPVAGQHPLSMSAYLSLCTQIPF